MEVLPEDVMIDILSRLTVKTIIHCKRVCKKWRNLVMESSFVNLHLSRSPTGLIIHHHITEDHRIASKDPGILKWVEIEDKVDHHHLLHDPLMSFDLKLAPILQNSLTGIVGSVNGLICLLQYYPKLDSIYICNPITGEIMILPKKQYYPTARVLYGFGVNSLTGEYKVVRMFQDISLRYKASRRSQLEAEVYTLGTGQWRNLGLVPYRLNEFYDSYGPFLNKHCHWIVCDLEDTEEKLCSFDLNKETFQVFPSPPSEAIQESRSYHHNLGVLKGCLCKLDTYEFQFTVWVMKEYGIKKSWHKELVITQLTHGIGYYIEWRTISLIEGLKDGTILMVYKDKLSAFCPQSGTIVDTKMFVPEVRALAYRPSFLKLENFESVSIRRKGPGSS